MFSVRKKTKSRHFQSLRFEERFLRALLSWRIRVVGRPNRKTRAALLSVFCLGLAVFCETVEDARVHTLVRGFCSLIVTIDEPLFFSLFLLRDRWVHQARSLFHLMKSSLPLDPSLSWALRSEDTRYVTWTTTEIDDKRASRRVPHINHASDIVRGRI